MTEKGICPKCGGQMDWKKVDFNPLNFLFFTSSPVVHAWKCRQCGNEIGRTDSTTETVPPPQAIKLPYQCKAYKRFTFTVHDCTLKITIQGLEFRDSKESQHSFTLTLAQIRQAKMAQQLHDIIFKLSNGTKYEVGLDKGKYDEVAAAIRILLEQPHEGTPVAATEVVDDVQTPVDDSPQRICKPADGHCKYKSPSSYAEVYVKVEPISGTANEIVEDPILHKRLPTCYIPSLRSGAREALESGRFTGVRVTVTDGSYHDMKSSDVAFHNATSEAVADALHNASPVISPEN